MEQVIISGLATCIDFHCGPGSTHMAVTTTSMQAIYTCPVPILQLEYLYHSTAKQCFYRMFVNENKRYVHKVLSNAFLSAPEEWVQRRECHKARFNATTKLKTSATCSKVLPSLFYTVPTLGANLRRWRQRVSSAQITVIKQKKQFESRVLLQFFHVAYHLGLHAAVSSHRMCVVTFYFHQVVSLNTPTDHIRVHLHITQSDSSPADFVMGNMSGVKRTTQ